MEFLEFPMITILAIKGILVESQFPSRILGPPRDLLELRGPGPGSLSAKAGPWRSAWALCPPVPASSASLALLAPS